MQVHDRRFLLLLIILLQSTLLVMLFRLLSQLRAEILVHLGQGLGLFIFSIIMICKRFAARFGLAPGLLRHGTLKDRLKEAANATLARRHCKLVSAVSGIRCLLEPSELEGLERDSSLVEGDKAGLS